jgi:tetratricopeptide (TPR) repeat protein
MHSKRGPRVRKRPAADIKLISRPQEKELRCVWHDVVAKKPHSAEGYAKRGYLLLQNKMLDEALSDFTTLSQLVPESTSIFAARNIAYIRLTYGEWETVRNMMGDCIEIEPSLGELWLVRGYVWTQLAQQVENEDRRQVLMGNSEEHRRWRLAIKDFNQAISCFEESGAAEVHAVALAERGTARNRLSNWGAAKSDFAEADRLGGVGLPRVELMLKRLLVVSPF